jgi:hypothetical protein
MRATFLSGPNPPSGRTRYPPCRTGCSPSPLQARISSPRNGRSPPSRAFPETRWDGSLPSAPSRPISRADPGDRSGPRRPGGRFRGPSPPLSLSRRFGDPPPGGGYPPRRERKTSARGRGIRAICPTEFAMGKALRRHAPHGQGERRRSRPECPVLPGRRGNAEVETAGPGRKSGNRVPRPPPGSYPQPLPSGREFPGEAARSRRQGVRREGAPNRSTTSIASP